MVMDYQNNTELTEIQKYTNKFSNNIAMAPEGKCLATVGEWLERLTKAALYDCYQPVGTEFVSHKVRILDIASAELT